MNREKTDMDKIYQRIGEFVVCFQWLENRFREVGWLILDPWRKEWPPKVLLDKVEALYIGLLDDLQLQDRKDRKEDFRAIIAATHELRRYRNKLLHSAFIELKSGGEVFAMLRSNPKLKLEHVSGEKTVDEEIMSEQKIKVQLEELGKIAFSLNFHYKQLLRWLPTPIPNH